MARANRWNRQVRSRESARFSAALQRNPVRPLFSGGSSEGTVWRFFSIHVAVVIVPGQ